MCPAFSADVLVHCKQRLVHAGRILGNDETLLASGVAKSPQVMAVLPQAGYVATCCLGCRICNHVTIFTPSLEQVVLSVKRVDTSSTTGVLNQQAAARGERPYDPPPAPNAGRNPPGSWLEQLEQESASNASREVPTCRICHSDHNGSGDREQALYTRVCARRWAVFAPFARGVDATRFLADV
jgi:hypothetical protein